MRKEEALEMARKVNCLLACARQIDDERLDLIAHIFSLIDEHAKEIAKGGFGLRAENGKAVIVEVAE